MSNHVSVDNQRHRKTRIKTTRCVELGDNQSSTLTFVDEFRSIQAHYPIFFRRGSSGAEFQPVALLGFEHGENLFLSEKGWDVPHVPVLIERQPFLIGHREYEGEQERVVHIDMDSPRVNEEEGEPLFDELGTPTDYLRRVSALLEATHLGLEENKKFVAMLSELQLLEPFSLDIELNNGRQHQLLGFYTINEDTVARLGAAQLQLLHEKGFLQAIYMILASHSHLRDLIQRKNLRLTQ